MTYIKLSRLDLHCVGRALAFHETRPRLLGMRLRGTGEGLFADATIAFNENLNWPDRPARHR